MFKYLEHLDLWVRTHNKSDRAIPNQMSDYKLFDLKDKTVMDIGANIGVFAKHAKNNQAKKIICYEPALDNFDMLKLNTCDMDNVELHRKAISDRNGIITLYRIENVAASNSVYPIRGADIAEQVEAISISDAITPDVDVIKMDIEGGEYPALLSCDIPMHVKQIIVEFHFKTKEMKELFTPTIEKLNTTWQNRLEPESIIPIRADGTHRHTVIGFWTRD